MIVRHRRSCPLPPVVGAAWSALLALLALLLVCGFPPGAQAAPSDPVAITLDDITPQYLGADDDLTFRGKITNNADTALDSITVWWRMRTPTLTDEALTRWYEEEEDDISPLTLARHDLPEPIEPGGSRAYEMVVPVENSPFDYGSAAGPRGIELVVTATDENGQGVRDHVRSTIIWYPQDAAPATPLTLAVPLTPTEPEWMDALAEEAPVADAAAARISGIVAELADHAITWGVDAALVDSVPTGRLPHALPPPEGAEPEEDGEIEEPLAWPASPEAREIARVIREHAARRSVVSLGWGGPDHNLLARAGADGDLLRDRNDSYAGAVLASAGLRTVEGTAWSLTPLVPGSASRFEEGTTTVIVPPTTLGTGFVPPTARHLTVRSAAQSLVDLLMREVDREELFARTLIHAEENEDLLVTLPPDLTPEQAHRVAQNLEVLADAPWVEPSPPTAATTAGIAASSAHPPAPELTPADVSRVAQALASTDSLARITDAPEQFTALVNSAAFLPLSHAWSSEPETRAGLVAQIARAADVRMLAIEQPSTVNLISQGGELPIGVENTGPLTLHPTVAVQPEDARLRADDPVRSTVGPEQSTTVKVPITAVANGNVTATIRLLDDEGEEVASPQTFTVRVRADWETTGTAVLAGLVAVGFLFGLIRNIRNAPGRAARRRDG